MPGYPNIERYHADLAELIELGGSDNELNIRPAFLNCLAAYCAAHKEKLALVPELASSRGNRPDGTIRDALRMARGYWEAKDPHDDLDAEIQAKFSQGYPQDNILFEDSRVAVLFQNGAEAMRVDMADASRLHRLIDSFLNHELPEIGEFRQARQQFAADLPSVLENLRQAVAEAEESNDAYRDGVEKFLELCHRSIGPAVSGDDVREMLLQHILTQDIFQRVFGEVQYHSENNIARQLTALENTFFTGDVRREARDRLQAYYGAIGRAADEIAEYSEKQRFLKAIYEDFYKAYNPAAADRLGVVYTPNEVVDFIIRGADHLLRKHFGRGLADDNVQILDPATGTGTFVTSLIDYLPADRLEYKYLNEIHANEVAILPYYIANLNIEYSYRERTGKYLGFPNLCFVDTLDNMDWQKAGATGGAVTRQGALFNLGSMSEENWIRVQEQNEKPISVIIGNPPYNDQQSNWYELNPNRKYPEIDQRIRGTYIEEGTAQRTHQYDMYKRFVRWASDRLADDGIIAFITNRAYLDTGQDDGFRQVAAKEFSDLYVIDLGSDVRRNPKISGTTHNVFGIQTGVAIGFFVRKNDDLGNFRVHYIGREDSELAQEKLAYLRNAVLDEIDFVVIHPDSRGNWLNQSHTDFASLVPLANRQTKLAKSVDDERAIFGLYSVGVSTNRDDWVYDFDFDQLRAKIRLFINTYEEIREEYGGEEIEDSQLGKRIKWTRDLKRQLQMDTANIYDRSSGRQALYRPFVSKFLYYSHNLNEMRYQMPQVFPDGVEVQNKTICFPGNASSNGFAALACDRVYSHDLLKTTQCLPLYRYKPDGQRLSNITEWGLRQFREHYDDDGITAEDIFAYTYAVLHDPVYRHDYAVDLLREFPRLPLYHDFDAWARMGRELLDLHINFESAEPFSLERVDKDGPSTGSGPAAKVRLTADKATGTIVLDDKTTLVGVPESAWRYRLGSRSALEWVLDQYKERKPRDPTIAEKFNTYRFADHKERVIDLLRRVCTVSVNTMAVVDDMAYWDGDNLVVFGDRDKHEWAMAGLAAIYSREEDEEWLSAWNEE